MNKIIIRSIILTLMFCSHLVSGQQSILFMGGIAHLGNGEKINNSIISIKNGEIDLVADLSKVRIDPEAFDTIYKIYGKHIYPGFIVPNTTLGITEIDAVRATHDYDEVGSINPNVRSQIAYNPKSKISETVVTNGVLLAQSTPRGGLVSGQSSLMYLHGWNWEDATCKADDGIHLNWPSSYYKTGWWAEQGETKKNDQHTEQINKIKNLLEKSLSYYKSKNTIDLKMESMKGLFNGTKNLYIHANYANDIIDAIDISKKYKVKKIVIIGGEDAVKVMNKLKENDIPVILNRVHRLPKNEDSQIHEPYQQPAILEKNGILFAFSYEGDMEAMGARNLPFSAGTAVAYGLDYEKAVSALTLNTAKILGVDNKIGTLEKGKEATLFISEGDALDVRSNNVTHIFIKGKNVDTDNHQRRLYKKYRDH
ncbi:amidohydrolase family protein [Flavobacteriales bacterium]|jgi:imidazolonepropionase-like amidohydrolase|nr:amidohydrolase family protein [Flavobacteriales bacterium]|tara:strand:+ start:5847 stop:7118 length:1272 start_codon:yes stop_codon:yes gene_type:complete